MMCDSETRQALTIVIGVAELSELQRCHSLISEYKHALSQAAPAMMHAALTRLHMLRPPEQDTWRASH